MSQFRFYEDLSYKIGGKKRLSPTTNCLLKHLNDNLFLEQVHTKTTTGRVGTNLQPRWSVDAEKVIEMVGDDDKVDDCRRST